MDREALKAAANATQFPEESLQVIRDAFNSYSGDISVLESAVGAFVMAHFFGYEPLRVMHSPVSMRKWAKILGIDWAEYFPAVGPAAQRSNGYQFALKLDSMKAAIAGAVSVPDRKTLTI